MAASKVLVDGSVLITSLLSNKGASYAILNQSPPKYQFFINNHILTETLDVLQEKFTDKTELPAKLFLLLGTANIEILTSPSQVILISLQAVIESNDAPILASALENCNYLISLDQDFLNDQTKAFAQARKLIILSPREFLKL